jgi:hypothetical protein
LVVVVAASLEVVLVLPGSLLSVTPLSVTTSPVLDGDPAVAVVIAVVIAVMASDPEPSAPPQAPVVHAARTRTEDLSACTIGGIGPQGL